MTFQRDLIYSLVEPGITDNGHTKSNSADTYKNRNTYNSWIILSKFTTANKREAIAAPEIKARATMRNSDTVFFTAAGETEGSGYTVDIDSGERRKIYCRRVGLLISHRCGCCG